MCFSAQTPQTGINLCRTSIYEDPICWCHASNLKDHCTYRYCESYSQKYRSSYVFISCFKKNTMDDQIYDLSSGNSRVVNKNKLINNTQKRGKYSKVENASYILFIHMTKQFYILWKSLIHLSCKKWQYIFAFMFSFIYLKNIT